jgi:hypothetical protein
MNFTTLLFDVPVGAPKGVDTFTSVPLDTKLSVAWIGLNVLKVTGIHFVRLNFLTECRSLSPFAMQRGRSPLPLILHLRGSRGRGTAHKPAFPALPALEPSPREVYSERELLLDQKFGLLTEINQLRAEVAVLETHFRKVAADHDARQEFEIESGRRNSDSPEPQAQADVHSLTGRQAALQREDEELEDQRNYLQRYFSADVADQIRTEVGVEKCVISRIKGQLGPLFEARAELASKLDSEALRRGSEKVAQAKAEIDQLSQLLRELEAEFDEGQTELATETDAEKRNREQDRAIEDLTQELRDLKLQKFGKQKQIKNLQQRFSAEEQGAASERSYNMLAQKSVYKRARFGLNLKEKKVSETNA